MLAIKQSIGSHHRRNGAARADHGVVRSWIKGEFGRGRCVSTDQEQQQQKLAAQYILNETAAKKHHQHVKRQMQQTRVKENRSEEHTSELQTLMRITYAVFCLKKNKVTNIKHTH